MARHYNRDEKTSHIPEVGEDIYKTTNIELVPGIYRELLWINKTNNSLENEQKT